MLWAEARALTGLESSIRTETEALQWTVESMAKFGYNNIIFETDSLALAKMINGTEEVWPKLQPVIDIIRLYLCLMFISYIL